MTKKCPVCCGMLNPLFHKDGYCIGQCAECRVMVVMDPVSASDLDQLYGWDYYAGDPSRYLETTHKSEKTWLRRLRMMENHCQCSGGKILDVGCGTGIFLEVPQRLGWDVWGCDISPESVAAARVRVGDDRITSDLWAFSTAGSFDVVTLWAVLERLRDPIAYLTHAHWLLRPGGVLALATVNTKAWNRRLFGSQWRYFTPPERLVYFDGSNLGRVIVGLGFNCEMTVTRFSDRAFWQGLGVDTSTSSMPVKALRRLLLLPARLVSKHVEAVISSRWSPNDASIMPLFRR